LVYYCEAAEIYRELKRYNDEIALIKRFAKNHDIHFRVLSERYRSTRGATHSWATNFPERIDAAKAAAAGEEHKDTVLDRIAYESIKSVAVPNTGSCPFVRRFSPSYRASDKLSA
jgi:hypothetical protein